MVTHISASPSEVSSSTCTNSAAPANSIASRPRATVRLALRQLSTHSCAALATHHRRCDRISSLFSETTPVSEKRRTIEPLLDSPENPRFLKPVAVGNYTDFYASIHHATNVGKLFRPDQPLLPNYKWIPIGYHGRASSLVISGTYICRPSGQTKLPEASEPTFAPTSQLDYELEVAAYIGAGNPLGEPISIASAEQHIFGLSLLNDWSARDIQTWEYQPLGPFLGKSFATSVSPFVVPMEALLPYRAAAEPRAPGDPEPLPYVAGPVLGAFDLSLEVFLSTAQMREASMAPFRLSTGNLRDLYWTFPQMIAHHTSNGCNLIEGDLLASGTISGPQRRLPRLPTRNHRARSEPNPTPQRRTAHLPLGRRRSHPPRPLRKTQLPPHQFRRMPRYCVGGPSLLMNPQITRSPSATSPICNAK